MEKTFYPEKILSIDIGGSNVKATILSPEGELTMAYQKLPTPQPASPENLLKTIQSLVQSFPSYDCISAGFPGYVKNGVVKTAPNLNTALWENVDLKKMLADTLGKPAKVVNDADMQGLGVVDGKGFEIVVTLGTGFGTALLLDGNLLPHLEIAHHPIKKGIDYDAYIGEKEMLAIGLERWNKRIRKVIDILKTVFNYDHLYIGGGNAKKLDFELEDNMSIVSNKEGIKGGARLWRPERISPATEGYTAG
jgi:polyphosphate glucokinase